jgi:hypothetical protein
LKETNDFSIEIHLVMESTIIDKERIKSGKMSAAASRTASLNDRSVSQVKMLQKIYLNIMFAQKKTK